MKTHKNILCLTGWQQPADALANIAPDAEHFDYAAYDDVRDMFTELPRTPKLAIGWSLGGQLLVRAIAEGYIKPEALLLLGTPFQWMTSSHFEEGVPAAAAAEAKSNYLSNPRGMLKNLNALITLGDSREKEIIRTLNTSLEIWKNGEYWLEELANSSCLSLEYAAFPPTLIVHGAKDKVIYPVNGEAFKKFIPRSELLLWPNCAHAPHLHDAATLRNSLRHYV